MTTILAIDTASADLALALGHDSDVPRTITRDANLDHSRLLLAAIDEILGGARADLSSIVIVRGPGSYSGIRVGMATAAGLAFSLGIPITGVSTLQAVALASGLDEVVAIHPAGRGEFAAQAYRRGEARGAMFAAQPQDLSRVNLAGEGAAALGGREVNAEARCRAALKLGSAIIAAGGSGDRLEALYLREPHISRPRRAPAVHP